MKKGSKHIAKNKQKKKNQKLLTEEKYYEQMFKSKIVTLNLESRTETFDVFKTFWSLVLKWITWKLYDPAKKPLCSKLKENLWMLFL